MLKFAKSLFIKENFAFWVFLIACLLSIGSYLGGNVRPYDPDTLTIADDNGLYGAISLVVLTLYFIVSNAVKHMKK